jgi:hemerythrin
MEEEHSKITTMISNLNDSSSFLDMMHYMMKHFDHEELVMSDIKYDLLLHHRNEHSKILKEFWNKHDMNDYEKLRVWSANQIKLHITMNDYYLVKFIKDKIESNQPLLHQ